MISASARLSTKRVPMTHVAAALESEARIAVGILNRNIIGGALEFAFLHAVDLAPVKTGAARYGVNPSLNSPRTVGHPPGKYSKPGRDRLPTRRSISRGAHAYLTFHAENRGFDYAGIKLEDGYSPQAPQGVIGPTVRALENASDRILEEAVRETEREIR